MSVLEGGDYSELNFFFPKMKLPFEQRKGLFFIGIPTSIYPSKFTRKNVSVCTLLPKYKTINMLTFVSLMGTFESLA